MKDMLKWLKKLFYGTKDGLPQKKISEEDLKKVEEYLEEHKDIIEAVKPYQMRSPVVILEEAGYTFEFASKAEELKKYDKLFTINDYSSSRTKRFLSMCAILHILGEDIDAYVYATDDEKMEYYKKYWDYLADCFVPMDKLLEIVQRNMKERNCYTTTDECISVFSDMFSGWVMVRVNNSPLYEYAHHSDRYN